MTSSPRSAGNSSPATDFLREESRGLFEDLAFLTEHLVLAPQELEFLALSARQAVFAAFVDIGLRDCS